jgi:pSer/pThr/pTyr-binding forkhead associated (FHA) protein
VAPRPNERLEYFPECYLVDLDGVTPSMRHELKRTNNIISRLKKPPDDGMNYIYIPRPSIGRRHALIEFRNLTFWIKDLGSVNGTRLNGRRINTETRLKHGDRIKFHTYEFEFSVADLAFSEPTEPAWQS